MKTNPYQIEQDFIQEISDMLCDRIGIDRVTVYVDGDKRMKRVRGQALLRVDVMRINARIVNSPNDLDETIRHEIAHFYAWHMFGHSGHGAPWKHACTITGASGNPTHAIRSESEALRTFTYVYRCGQGCKSFAYRIKPRYERGHCAKHNAKYIRHKCLTTETVTA